MMTKILLTLTALISIKAFAGTETHGGNLLICQENGKTIKEVLDFHEGKRLFKNSIDMGNEKAPYLEQLKYVFNRLAKIDPVAASRYLERAQKFEKEMSIIPDSEMKRIKDNTSIVDFPNCKKIQLAAQIVHPNVGMSRYLVNRDYYPNASERIKAELVLHEIVLTDPINEGIEDSDSTREFVYQISSSLMNNINSEEYSQIVHKVFEGKNIPSKSFSLKINNIFLYAETYLFSDTNETSSGVLANDSSINILGNNLHLPKNLKVELRKQGEIMAIDYNPNAIILNPTKSLRGNFIFENKPYEFFAYYVLTVASGSYVNIQNKTLKLVENRQKHSIILNSNKTLKRVEIYIPQNPSLESFTFNIKGGTTKTIYSLYSSRNNFQVGPSRPVKKVLSLKDERILITRTKTRTA
jgi:hypothetical protein